MQHLMQLKTYPDCYEESFDDWHTQKIHHRRRLLLLCHPISNFRFHYYTIGLLHPPSFLSTRRQWVPKCSKVISYDSTGPSESLYSCQRTKYSMLMYLSISHTTHSVSRSFGALAFFFVLLQVHFCYFCLCVRVSAHTWCLQPPKLGASAMHSFTFCTVACIESSLLALASSTILLGSVVLCAFTWHLVHCCRV